MTILFKDTQKIQQLDKMISILPLENIPIIHTKEEFWKSLLIHKEKFQDDDILVVAHTPWSRVDGPVYKLEEIQPSSKAIELGEQLQKDPRHVEIILRESKDVVKYGRKVIVTENHAGVICANAGIDQSNAGLGQLIAVPHDPDKLAQEIREYLRKETGKIIAVIISDTVGRALRKGAVNIGIGVAGIHPMRSEIGKKDLFGYTMRVSEVAVIDEIASAAELVQGQTDEANPFVIIRGLDFDRVENTSARNLNRPKEERIFQ